MPINYGPYAPVYGDLATKAVLNLHGHTVDSDGSYSAAQYAAYYEGVGHDAFVITDHDLVTADPGGHSLIYIPGAEQTLAVGHILSIGTDYLRGAETDPQTIIDGILADGGVAIMAHPNYTAEWDTTELTDLIGYHGVEIFNEVVTTGIGAQNPQTNPGFIRVRWDYPLTNVRTNVWGFGGDDFHDITYLHGYNCGRNVVFVDNPTLDNVITSLKNGNFCVDVTNFGVTPTKPTVSNTGISITCPGAKRIMFVGDDGITLETDEGESGAYTFGLTETYVRMEVVGDYTEGFDAAIDTANRWGVNSGTWSVGSGILSQSADTAGPHFIILKRFHHGDFTATYKVRVNASAGTSRQGGMLFNYLNNTNTYYVAVEPPAATGDLVLWKYDSSSTPNEVARDASFSASNNTWYNVKIQYTRSVGNIKIRVWAVGSGEPETWNIDIDDLAVSWWGGFGFRVRYLADFDDLYIDGFKTYYQPIDVASAKADTYTPSPEPTGANRGLFVVKSLINRIRL